MGSDRKAKEKEKKKSRKRSSSPDSGEERRSKRHRSDKKDKGKEKKSHKHRSDKEKKPRDKHRDKYHKGTHHSNYANHLMKHVNKFVDMIIGNSAIKAEFQELTNDDYFSKNNEFATWLKEEKKVFFSDLSSESAHEYFSAFVKAWNKQKLDSRYYEGISSGPRSAHNWKFK